MATATNEPNFTAATTMVTTNCAQRLAAGLRRTLGAIACYIETTANKARALTTTLAGCRAVVGMLSGALERLLK